MIDWHRLDSVETIGLDNLFAKETKEVFAKTNCLDCANCCKNYSPIIEEDEIPRLLKVLGVDSKTFFEDYVEMDDEGDFVFRSQPCPLLDLNSNECKIYDDRPRACRSYPHTNMKSMELHFDLLEKNIDICPAANEIVLRVIEKIENDKA